MIKAHKRKNSGSMRRASRVYLTCANAGKVAQLRRLAQCAAKQAKEMVRSQKERKIKTMPLLRRKVATLDNRFVRVEEFKGAAFDLAITFSSGLPKITTPIGQTAHMNRLLGQGFRIGSTLRLGMDGRGVWIELIFEKERPALQTEGKTIGIDRGYRKAFVTSDGQEIGAGSLLLTFCSESGLVPHGLHAFTLP